MVVIVTIGWLFLLGIGLVHCQRKLEDLKLVVVTVATKETDGYQRFMRSCRIYNIDVRVFGMNEKWLGGDMERGAGGGHKINILKSSLEEFQYEKNTVVMFTDSYDVIFTAGENEILKKFLNFDANVVISTENFCWPDKSLSNKYPEVKSGYRYLCSGGIIGYAPTVYDMINFKKVQNTDDDQLYYTNIFLYQRDKFNLKLDHTAEIFQNLNGNIDDIELRFDLEVRVHNIRFHTIPSIIHGNGPSKIYLNYLGNYLARSWTFGGGCLTCKEDVFNLDDIKVEKYPRVLIALFIEKPTPFVRGYLERISQLNYPKTRIDIFLHSADPYHNNDVNEWKGKYNSEYNSIKYLGPHSFLKVQEAKHKALAHCRLIKCDYYMNVDADVTLTNKDTLRILMEQNRTLIAPMLSRHQKLWSNFWGAVGSDGFYARSDDYIDVVKYVRRGVWNVPYLTGAYLIKAAKLTEMIPYIFESRILDPDMMFCQNLRKLGIHMYVTNMDNFGHLKDTDNYSLDKKHNDMYEIFANRLDWEDKYLHPNFSKFLDRTYDILQPCPDVYWFPIITDAFAKELIEECEHLGEWSGGKHKDARLSGGYENVPTDDIHMKQIKFEKHWLHIIKEFISPMATRIYEGYYSYSHAIMNFVVKYHPSRQNFLRPHHDASTYTVNVALNQVGVDYEGGGSRFLRYNCSVPGTRTGWSLMHPGALTHYHEGLHTTKGTRYIMVSFIDP